MLARSDHGEPSVFLPENLLRESRRQRGLAPGRVPSLCVLDPDGDIVRYLRTSYGAQRSNTWACYHTDLWEATLANVRFGIVGGAVGAPFAVLVAEELCVSGCELLVSITSAGRIADDLPPEGIVLIEHALRGEGASAAYLPAAPEITVAPDVRETIIERLRSLDRPVLSKTAWTTDAPFRETATALRQARAAGADIVEMEAAALYAFGAARGKAVVCLAQVTNGMAITEGDFEKGAANGAEAACTLIAAIGRVNLQDKHMAEPPDKRKESLGRDRQE